MTARRMKSKLRGITIEVVESHPETQRPIGGTFYEKQELRYWRNIGPREAVYRNAGTFLPLRALEAQADDWKAL